MDIYIMLKFCEVKQSGSDISTSSPPGSGDVKNTLLKVGLKVWKNKCHQ